ncbi:MAG TPA: hypothetical protein VNL77_19975 [Roseiflexaceae bacterium]|nr:hypothetical protein [Roseiflexaceae bacterium]
MRPHRITMIQASSAADRHSDRSLQMVLWTLWTAVVVAVAVREWRLDVALHRLVGLVGLATHCAVAGVIGLVILTLVEMRMEPWRFVDEAPR